MAKRALITGITGQDGAYLARLLLDTDYEVIGLSRNSTKPNIRGLRYLGIENEVAVIRANLLDRKNVINIMEKTEPDEVYNLAAQSSVGLSFEQPVGTLQFNILSAANLLEAIRFINPNIKYYQASSSEMYGSVCETGPSIEHNCLFHPVSPYGISKAAAHWITVNYREAYGLFAVSGILFNHESALRGASFVTKKIINTAVGISRGSADSLTLGNLQVYRDWGYAPDYVKAMWLMLQREEPDDFIVCSGECHSLKEFAEQAFKKLDLDFERFVTIDTSLHRQLELDVACGDNSKAKELLGWQYDITFEQLIATLVNDEMEYADWKDERDVRND